MEDWKKKRAAQPGPTRTHRQTKTAVRRRPVSKDELANSIIHIWLKNRELAEDGTLVKIGPRKWRLRVRE